MKIVFDAANAMEAHMVKDLLAMQGVASRIQGEHLQSGVGELPALGLVKVSVEEVDMPRREQSSRNGNPRSRTWNRRSEPCAGCPTLMAISPCFCWDWLRAPLPYTAGW